MFISFGLFKSKYTKSKVASNRKVDTEYTHIGKYNSTIIKNIEGMNVKYPSWDSFIGKNSDDKRRTFEALARFLFREKLAHPINPVGCAINS